MTPPAPARAPRSRRRLLRAWAAASAASVLIAALGSAQPFMAAVARAPAAPAPTLMGRKAHPRGPADGPIPDAPDGPAEVSAKAAGAELWLLAGPPLLLLWLGWDVWFALVGFFPALAGGSARRAQEPETGLGPPPPSQ